MNCYIYIYIPFVIERHVYIKINARPFVDVEPYKL